MKRFILLLFTIVLTFALVACDDTEDTSSSDTDTDTEEVNEDIENEDEAEEASGNLSIGDTAEFDNVKFTLKEVSTTDERNQFADEDPTTVVKIEYELENIGDDDLPYGADVTVYDAAGNQMDSYPLDNDMGSLAPGKKVQGAEHHAIDEVGTIEIHFAPLISFESAAVFEVDIE